MRFLPSTQSRTGSKNHQQGIQILESFITIVITWQMYLKIVSLQSYFNLPKTEQEGISEQEIKDFIELIIHTDE